MFVMILTCTCTMYMHVHLQYIHGCIFVGLESRLREASRQLSLSELSREQLNSELEALRLKVQDGHQWETEKQVTFVCSLSLSEFHLGGQGALPPWILSAPLGITLLHAHTSLPLTFPKFYPPPPPTIYTISVLSRLLTGVYVDKGLNE